MKNKAAMLPENPFSKKEKIMSEIRKIRIKTSRQKPSDPYRTYMLLHILLGFPLTALLIAVLADIIVWLQSGRYQGLAFWLPFIAGLMFILWLPVSVICGFLMGNIARKSGWKRNRAGMVGSALLSAMVYAISLLLIFFLMFATGGCAKCFKELGWIILQALLFGVFAGVVGGLFAWALPREQAGDADDNETQA